MRFKVRIRLEQKVVKPVPPKSPGDPPTTKTEYLPLGQTSFMEETAVSQTECQDRTFPDVFNFEHEALYSELSRQFLAFYLIDASLSEQGPQ